jgi:hypothetical protein
MKTIFNIKLRRRQIAGFVLAGLLLSLNFMMRYGVWKTLQYYNLEKTRYEKLDLAYQLKGREGIDYELKNILRHNPSAKDFVERTGKQLGETKDAALFLKAAHAKDREKIDHLKSNRFIISFAVYVIVAFQVLLGGFVWIKDHRHEFKPRKDPS